MPSAETRPLSDLHPIAAAVPHDAPEHDAPETDAPETGAYEPGAYDPDHEPHALEPDVEAMQAVILGKLDEDKAEDVVVIDLQGKSPLADAIVVASGRSARHVSALADHLQRALKDAGFGRVQVEGLPQADWVLLDAGDVIVHLFRPEVRAFYQIEKIWSVDSPHRTPAALA